MGTLLMIVREPCENVATREGIAGEQTQLVRRNSNNKLAVHQRNRLLHNKLTRLLN